MDACLELILKIGLFAISIFTLLKGIYEYSKAQKWKKAEFVAKEIKDFNADFDIMRALTLLDWKFSEIPLRENEIENKKMLHFEEELLINALKIPPSGLILEFTNEEALIRKIFDVLFDRLLMYEHYIKTGLIKIDDIKLYLEYWISILANSENSMKSLTFKIQLYDYLKQYGYSELFTFYKRFGYDTKYLSEIVRVNQPARVFRMKK